MQNWINFVRHHPHEFTIQYPPRREYFQEHFQMDPLPDLFEEQQELLLYLHIPFCEAKCYYCNFAVDTRDRDLVYERYTKALMNELGRYADWPDKGKVFTGIDIGGGTPTRLPLPFLEALLHALQPFKATSRHPFPLSIETTPRIAAREPEKMHMLAFTGVDRLSMGIQSFNKNNLKEVNRAAQSQMNEQATAHIRAAGFQRFNVDLIFGLPAQTLDIWRDDLERVIVLQPDSITTYDCLYRGKGRLLTRRTPQLPGPETYGRMYDLAYELLLINGYQAPYGSVNFSRHPHETGTSANFEARLLDGKPYLGLGNYSSSWIGNCWFFNQYRVNDYIQAIEKDESPVGDFYYLPDDEAMAKYLLYSLNFGLIDGTRFGDRFGVAFEEIYAEELDLLCQQQLMYPDGWLWKIKPGRFDQMPVIRSLFYSGGAKEWLMGLKKATGFLSPQGLESH